MGRGGMGVIYAAEHVRLQKRVALKVMAPELADDQEFSERFVREARLAASPEHPNIVPVDDAGEVDGTLFVAMRFVRGTNLAEVIDALIRSERSRSSSVWQTLSMTHTPKDS